MIKQENNPFFKVRTIYHSCTRRVFIYIKTKIANANIVKTKSAMSSPSIFVILGPSLTTWPIIFMKETKNKGTKW